MKENNVAFFLKQIRNNKEITSENLSKSSGVSQSYISQLETGQNKNPGIQVLYKLSKGLDISLGDLIIGIGYPLEKNDQKINENKNQTNIFEFLK